MNLEKDIQKAVELIQWLDRQIDGLEVSSDFRTRISSSCLDIALEHQKSIILLVSHKLFGSAFSLVRLIFEAYIRGLWLFRCASEQEIEKYKKGKLEKNFTTLIAEIEQIDGFQEGVLSTVKKKSWSSMNSYTHTGFLQTVRRNTSESIEPNYALEEIIEVINYANSVGLLSALQITSIAGDEMLAKDLLEKSKVVFA